MIAATNFILEIAFKVFAKGYSAFILLVTALVSWLGIAFIQKQKTLAKRFLTRLGVDVRVTERLQPQI